MKQIEKLLSWLNAANVRYVIIGATAFAAHGWVRATADLDLFIDAAADNIAKLCETLTEFGYDVSEASADDFARYKILLRQYDLPLDLHPYVAGDLPFADVWERRIVAKIGEVEAPFASLDDMIAMKRAAGRSKDTEDLRQLQKIRAARDRG